MVILTPPFCHARSERDREGGSAEESPPVRPGVLSTTNSERGESVDKVTKYLRRVAALPALFRIGWTIASMMLNVSKASVLVC